MPSKKRKYEARFPPARIKKIMQTDEEIGKVAAAVPVIISRSLEIFLQSLVETTAQYTNERKAKTMTTSHLKHCIGSEGKFDFLKDLVANIADITNEDDDGGGEAAGDKPKKQRKPRQPNPDKAKKKKKKESSSEEESDVQSDVDETGSAQRSFPSSPNPTEDSLPDDIPPINIPPINIPPLEPTQKHVTSLQQSVSAPNSSSSAKSGQAPQGMFSTNPEGHGMSPHGIPSPKHVPVTHSMSPQRPPHGIPSPKHVPVTHGMSPQRNALPYSPSGDVAVHPPGVPLEMLSSRDVYPPVPVLPRESEPPVNRPPVVTEVNTSTEMPLHCDALHRDTLHRDALHRDTLHRDALHRDTLQRDAQSPIAQSSLEKTSFSNMSSSPSTKASLGDAASLNAALNVCTSVSSSRNDVSSESETSNMVLSITEPISTGNATSSLITSTMSALNATSSLNASPNIPPHINMPQMQNAISPSSATTSRNAPSPIYMPDERQQSINRSNITDRAQLSLRSPVPSALRQGPGVVQEMSTKLPPRPSHSIDSIMGNISSTPSQQQQREDHQPSQPSAISSNFMPNFNFHPSTSVPSISTSFHMNFPSSFKVANDDEDDYDT